MRLAVWIGALSVAFASLASALPKPSVETPFVFTDETAHVHTGIDEGEIACHVAAIATEGFGLKRTEILPVVDGRVAVKPLTEAIHVVSLGPPVNAEIRFLALAPPPPLDSNGVLRQLPRSGEKLLAGAPYTLLAMGDSVTATGEYGEMLAMLLARATGNTNIVVVKKAYSGRSVDATVRNFDRDVQGVKPDLGLLMYGLNDQICFVPLRAFLEQYAWVSDQLRERFDADTIYLQPTPHIATLRSGPTGGVEPPEFAFRTIGYAHAIAELGARNAIPVARTFGAVWGGGGNTVAESALALWPLYPTSCRAQFSTLLEHAGRGDTIHPNALGHLQIAKAAFAAMIGEEAERTLALHGESRWTDQGVVSRVTAVNRSDKSRTGRLAAFAPTAAQIAEPGDVAYTLEPGEAVSFDVEWPDANVPEDLLRFPNDVYLSQELIPLFVVDFSGGRSQVHCVVCPFEVEGDFVPCRTVVEGRDLSIALRTKDGVRERLVQIPDGSLVGRIPVVETLTDAGRTGHAVAEVLYTSVAIAPVGEAEVDGRLGEWDGQPTAPVGLACQARGWRGPADNRASPEEAQVDFLFKAGADGVYIALRGRGVLTNDTATIFFDPRPPAQLGTAGPYYWVDLSFAPAGLVKIRKGETSVTGDGLRGAWLVTEAGLDAECFIPYAVMDASAWPASGDLGLSLIWRHQGVDGKATRLAWSEDGHEWNPCGYGIVQRLQPGAPSPRRYVARVK
ncbi:MAG: SGNH/GDSL hydrolase family protein [Kiritimatiellia bacterium]|jgi:lysophospholipase L1-like esterase